MRMVMPGFATLMLASVAMPQAAMAPVQASAGGDPAARCAAYASSALGDGVQLTRVHYVETMPAGTVKDEVGMPLPVALPGHCMVEGTINQRTNSAGQELGIGFNLALPDNWNGRFLLMGGGGLNGAIRPAIGPVAAGNAPALSRGFAVLSHDSGHKGAVFDASFSADQRAALDFAEASVKTVTLLGKRITSDFYGHDIAYSYMTGCSTGGREGMLASQRYPELFDGIVVGAPAMMTGHSNLAIEYSATMFNRAAPLAEDGLPDVTKIFSAGDRQLILGGMLKQCDALDGLADGVIMNVAQCAFEPAKLQCRADSGENCLSADKVKAMELAFAGPKDAAGYPLYHPVPYDTGIVDASPGQLPGYLPTGRPGVFGPATRATEIDLDARIHAIRANAMQRLTDTHVWTNLNTFTDRGGKILFYHGVSDAWFSAWATWDYFQRAAEANGDVWQDTSRFYMVPGMGHCRGGNAFDNFDLLSPLMDWVEKGEAPGTVVASRSTDAADQRPLCEHPAYAHYTGGDPKSAASYECRLPVS